MCGAAGRFEAFHDVAFDGLAVADVLRLAQAAAVPDLAAFRACVGQGEAVAMVERDVRERTAWR